MQKLFLIYSLLVLSIFAHSQDTVIIRSMKFYKEGKVNILVSPGGNKTRVDVLSKETWVTSSADDQDLELNNIDTSSDNPVSVSFNSNAFFKSYVNPALTTAQKKNIKKNECKNAKFAGLSRAYVKTNIGKGFVRTYSSLHNFLRSLPRDMDMDEVVDALKKPWRERSIQEMKNVSVKNIYLIAYAREKDNDYHLILTDSAQTEFFNAEISGLPSNATKSFNTLKAVRTSFENFPGALSCGNYTKLDTPLK
ncbi:MAG: hypothetical protein ACXWCZ_12085, partial [Flavisolibacter sp.]